MESIALGKLFVQMTERQQRLSGCDCAERVLHFIEKKNPKELRSRQAIEAARAYAQGLIDHAALVHARSESLAVCGAFMGHPLSAAAVAAAATTCEQPMDLYFTCLNDWAIARIIAPYGKDNLLVALMSYAAERSRSIIGFYASSNQQLRDDAEASEYEWQMTRARWYLDGEIAT